MYFKEYFYSSATYAFFLPHCFIWQIHLHWLCFFSFLPTSSCSKCMRQRGSDLPERWDMPQQRPLPVPCCLHWYLVRGEAELQTGSWKLQSRLWAGGNIITTAATSITPGCFIRIKWVFCILGCRALEASTTDCFKKEMCHWKLEKNKVTAAAAAATSRC